MSKNTGFTDHQSIRNYQPGLVHHVGYELDFSVNPVAAGDTFSALKVPKDAIVTGIDQIIITPGSAGITVGYGDGTTATLFDAAVAMDAAANTHTGTDPATETALAATNGKHYTADGEIIGTPSGALSAGKVWIDATYKLLNRPAA